jgi:two-component system KDP operon response regulator KdpE
MSEISKILVIEDEAPLRLWVCTALSAKGYLVFEATTGSQGIGSALAVQPDVILLDLGLPDMEGLEVIRQLRNWSNIPIIIASARCDTRDKTNALDAGAIDFLTKPYPVDRLLSAIGAAVRQTRASREPCKQTKLAVGPFGIDLVSQVVRVNDRVVQLARSEFRIVAALARHVDQLLTYRSLLSEAFGEDRESEIPLLKMTIAGLRRKLESDPLRPQYLLSETGVGYRLLNEPKTSG